MTPGVYTYAVTGVAPCVDATATVTVTENAATDAGTNSTLDLCSNGASSSLFAQPVVPHKRGARGADRARW
ncbi:MAG: hypothetical protein IPI07_15625 [Flavobacteriales bacterium]|nr:hypothetical protein [Flavobacteriales bacterium]